MATSTIPAYRAALVSDITAQLATDGVTGVKVRSFVPTSWDRDRTDTIFFGDADGEQEHLTYGGSRTETFELDGNVVVFNSGGTDGDAIAAETRAFVVLASVENALRTDHETNSTVFHGQIQTYRSSPAVDDQGFWCLVEFVINVEAHI